MPESEMAADPLETEGMPFIPLYHRTRVNVGVI